MTFKKGDDPNRWKGGTVRKALFNGMTIADLAQEHTPDSIKLLAMIQANLDEDGTPKEYAPRTR